jgi:hypothetical protein
MNAAAIEAGLLRASETIIYGALVAGAQAALPLLNASSASAVDWASVTHTFLAAMVVGALAGLRSYHGAVGAGVGAVSQSNAAPAPASPSEPSAGA